MAVLPKAPTTDFTSTTLNGSINASATTITVNDASKIQVPTYIVVDRQDANGNNTANAREVMYVSAKSGNDLTVTRGVNNSTARSHNDASKVEPIFTVGMYADLYTVFTQVHDTSGNINGNIPITPVWVIPGVASAATTSIGKPLDMPSSATIQWASVTLRAPISGASLIIDINKNFSSIFQAGTRPFILGGGTFVSTASINTKNFVAGDVFSVDIDAGGWFQDAVVKFRGI